MKKLITLLFCLTFLFGGLADCATAATAGDTAVTITETQETPTIVDFKFLVSELPVTAIDCEDNKFSTIPWLVMAVNSEGDEAFSDYVVIYDIKCKDYVLFYISFNGPRVVNKFNSLEDILTRLRMELKDG